MCGIAGIWTRPDDGPKSRSGVLRTMLARLAHRGPDDDGVWEDPCLGLALGHRRLSVIDLSAAAHQPMTLPGSGLTLVFNGEIYNYRELRAELGGDAAFCSRGDSEVLLRAYERWGTGLLGRLVGMFAFALWDAGREVLFLARDRAGEKPLYWSRSSRGFAFASELGALACLPGFDSQIDPEALAAYLELQYIPAPLSIYLGARKLPPGHAMTVSRAGVRAWRYWDPVETILAPRLALSEDQATEQLEALLRDAVRGQMIADVPLGAFLSGGIDSSLIVSTMVELATAPIRTFTIGFDVPEFNEAPHAEAVASSLGTEHTTEYLTEADALALIPRVPEIYGEPFADSSALPTHLVSRVARRYVTVSLSGDGGDELFGGYTRYVRLAQALRVKALAGPAAGLVGHAVDRLRGRECDLGTRLPLPPSGQYRSAIRVFSEQDALALSGTRFRFDEFDRAWALDGALSPWRRAMLADLLTYLPEAILTKVDRAAMAVSLEVRVPLLDHRIIEFSLRLPEPLVRQKRLLRRAAYRRLPRKLLERPKKGFGVPLAKWFRSDLRDLVADALAPARLREIGIRDAARVTSILAEHLAGRRDHATRLWALLVLSLWHDHEAKTTAGVECSGRATAR